jgi:hypothetical protein
MDLFFNKLYFLAMLDLLGADKKTNDLKALSVDVNLVKTFYFSRFKIFYF